MGRQRLRRWTRGSFFLLFIVAPPLDIFRFDLLQGHFIFFGMDWSLGLTALASGDLSAGEAAARIFLLGFLPGLSVVALGVWLSWRYGRLYCGWLCPHFSVVEMINSAMRRATGKPSLWEKEVLPEQDSDGTHHPKDRRYWFVVIVAVAVFAFIWAVVLLTYLLPPTMIYNNLFQGQLSRNQSLFISVATLLFSIEFLLARHLFCRFGCAVGLFQSLAWMCNDRALIVDFDRGRGAACRDCTQACDNVCPMRLNPRKNKRHMFTCTQCALCVEACEKVQAPGGSLLHWHFEGGRGCQAGHQAPIHFSGSTPHSSSRRG